MRFHTQAAVAGGLCLGLASIAAIAAPCAGFVDVSDTDAAYCAAVTLIKDRGVTLGCSDSAHFCPNDYVTRLQMALFMQRLARGNANNTLGSSTASVAGDFNEATGDYATVGGGEGNSAQGRDATVAGGNTNVVTGLMSSIIGGHSNTAHGDISAVLGGYENAASGYFSLVAGHHALAESNYCAVLNFRSEFAHSMSCFGTTGIVRIAADHGMSIDFGAVRSDGGGQQWILLGDTLGDMISASNGAKLTSGGAWTNGSDRNSKTDFAEVDPLDVLDKVVAMPVSTWRYKLESDQRHLGPMAQDFHAAFGLGADDRHITTVDAAGVAFAAIKGLDEKLAATRAALEGERVANAELRWHNEALERRLAAVERSLAH